MCIDYAGEWACSSCAKDRNAVPSASGAEPEKAAMPLCRFCGREVGVLIRSLLLSD